MREEKEKEKEKEKRKRKRREEKRREGEIPERYCSSSSLVLSGPKALAITSNLRMTSSLYWVSSERSSSIRAVRGFTSLISEGNEGNKETYFLSKRVSKKELLRL